MWFEHVRRFWPMHPTRFAFGVMTRSKAITYDDLALRAPDFVQEVDALFAQEVAGNAEPAEATKPPMFQPWLSATEISSERVSDKVMYKPPCPSSTPLSKNCKARVVLPVPGAPSTRYMRWGVRPPPRISSIPSIPEERRAGLPATCLFDMA